MNKRNLKIYKPLRVGANKYVFKFKGQRNLKDFCNFTAKFKVIEILKLEEEKNLNLYFLTIGTVPGYSLEITTDPETKKVNWKIDPVKGLVV